MLPKGYLKSLFVAHGALNDFQVLPVLVFLAIPVMLTKLIRWLVLLVGKGWAGEYFYFAPPWAKGAQRLHGQGAARKPMEETCSSASSVQPAKSVLLRSLDLEEY